MGFMMRRIRYCHMCLDGTCRSPCIFSFSLIYFTQIPEDHIWCAPLCAVRGKTLKAAGQGPQLLSANQGGWASHPGKVKTRWDWRRMKWCRRQLIFGWPKFHPNWYAWQMERTLAPLGRIGGSAEVLSWQPLWADDSAWWHQVPL